MLLIGDLLGVGLAQSDLSLSMCKSMKRLSQFSSCDVNVNCAINVLKFRLGRFQKIVTQMRRLICPINPRKVQMMAGMTMSHCLSNCRQFWKGMDRLTQDRSVLRCSSLTCRGWLELISLQESSAGKNTRKKFSSRIYLRASQFKARKKFSSLM